ncbi:MAG TPA: DeoR/GlpR family DNA-binding transcription regulator [Pelolinea sp.]|nr:DeoR/GlpR family DNA-binding transcription regulator [Pelolinea sp.]
MLAEERRAILHNKLREDGYVQVTELADDLGISSATIRRDLIMLEKQGVCIRKRGGAIRTAHGVTTEIPYEIKRRRNTDEKNRIAKAAMKFVENGDTILLDAGSTTYALALMLHHKERLTVVTHDLNIAVKLAANPAINLICTGGIARENVFTLEGSQVTDFIRTLRVDKTFIGADAIHTDGVISNVNIQEVPIKQAMINASDVVVLLTDSSKFGTTGFAKVCDITDCDHIVTDDALLKEYQDLIKRKNVDLTLA